MKTLQSDLTTIEQSNRLLESGIPKDSANHYYGKDGKPHYIDGTIPYSLLWETGCTSCWSVGRLMEIFITCAEYYTGDNSLVFNRESVSLGNINCLIPVIELAVKDKCIDFSKLEE